MNAIFNMETASNATGAPINPQPSAAPLAQKALLVTLTIQQWAGRKLDKGATAKITRDAGAASNAARVTKSLVASQALAEITAIANKARAEHYTRALAWSDNGTRILSSLAYLDYCNVMSALQAEFRTAVEKFISNYADYRDKARDDLGAMFDELDYPSASELRARFSFPRPRFCPIPSAADFRVDIGAEFIADERRAIEQDLRDMTETAMRDVFGRIAETVGTMAEKLNAFKPANGKGDKAGGIFRDSLVENVRSLVAVLPSLNITGDSRLNAIAERMAELCKIDASDLRIDAAERANVAQKAAEIVADVEAYF